MPLQPKDGHTDHQRHDDGNHGADHHPDPRGQPPLVQGSHGGVRADAEKHGMTKGHLPGIAADQVPGLAQGRVKQQHDQQVLKMHARDDQRRNRESQQNAGESDDETFSRLHGPYLSMGESPCPFRRCRNLGNTGITSRTDLWVVWK
jgi:hypothetical protein